MNTTRVRKTRAAFCDAAWVCNSLPGGTTGSLEYVARRTGLKAEVIDRIEIGKGNVAWGDLLALIDFYGWRFDFNPEKDEKTV